MAGTSELIDNLVAAAVPVRPLRPPLLRALGWLAFAAVVVAGMALLRGVRPDLGERLQEAWFVLGMAGALATAVLAAVAAFQLSLPDRSSRWLLLPLPALALWAATIGYSCLTRWVAFGPGSISLGPTVQCFVTLLVVSVPLFGTLILMVRRTVPLRPVPALATGGLAVAGASAAALMLIHPIDATVMVLVANLGVAAMFATLGAVSGATMGLQSWKSRLL